MAAIAVWYVTSNVIDDKFNTRRTQFWSVFAILTLMVFAIISAQTGNRPTTGSTRGIPFLTANKTYYPATMGVTGTDENSNALYDTQMHMYHFIPAIIGVGLSFALKRFYFSGKSGNRNR